MNSDTRMTSWRSARALTTLVFASMLLAGGAAAAAGNKHSRGETVFVSGNSVASGTCGLEGSDFALQMFGDLEGCLSVYVGSFKCEELEHFDYYRERGREVFVGTLRGEEGRFNTRYTFEGVFAKGFCQSFDLSLEVGGGCTHLVRGTSGAFRGAFGVIKFIDVIGHVSGDPLTGEFMPGTGINNLLYTGHIRLD